MINDQTENAKTDSRQFKPENLELVILLLLALSVFLAGIHLGWRLCLVGGGWARHSWRQPTWKSTSGFWSSSGLWFWPLFSYGNTCSAVGVGKKWSFCFPGPA